MAAFGFGVYRTMGTLRSRAADAPNKPTAVQAQVDLPGTVFVAQQGVLYRLSGGTFTVVQKSNGGIWLQPTVSPDHSRLVAVLRGDQFSDLYSMDLAGQGATRLTNNAGGRGVPRHWAFYPRFSPDGSTLFYSYDGPKAPGDFKVDFALWSMAVGASQRTARQVSTPNDYTGGDTYPVPLAGGGLLYAKYSIGNAGPQAQLWYQARHLSAGVGLTPPGDDCQQPALSPDATKVAMICTAGKQDPRLEVASFDGAGTLGTPSTLLAGQLAASPAWSPDGKTILFLAAAGPQRHFQLWTIDPGAAGATGLAKQVTDNLDFDATSAPAWIP